LKSDSEFEDINRATLAGYEKYMLLNPVFFKALNYLEATQDNIRKTFKALRRQGLVAAKDVRPDCECKFCKQIDNAIEF